MSEHRYEVKMLTRVEGEGRFTLRVQDGKVVQSHLSIFEAPRFFEAMLQQRPSRDVIDIVARICGICPVAYQMSAARALEDARNLPIGEALRKLRRLLYCGEWLESHALHVFMLHAPDYLGYESAVQMAEEHRELVERGLRIKRAGNELIAVLGGRATHPVSPCIGGFTKVPQPADLRDVRKSLQEACELAERTVTWTASLPGPDFHQAYTFVSCDADEYPLETATGIRIGDNERIDVAQWDERFEERQVPHSNALQCLLIPEAKPYLTGPMARIAHHWEKLHPRARAALEATGLELPIVNPYLSIVARSVELVHAAAEAMDLIDAYSPPTLARLPSEAPAAGRWGYGATEAPRGMLWHAYEMESEDHIRTARIVPPTSQNQARIEADLVALAPEILAQPHDRATLRCEQLIRAYDPCISCATHFLRLDIQQDDTDPGPS